MFNVITVRHNAELAHRLSSLPGKCENIHGHSVWFNLSIQPTSHVFIPSNGIYIPFGDVKQAFREFLDSTWDHRCLLMETDPLAKLLRPVTDIALCSEDPTTENLARWTYEWAHGEFGPNFEYRVEVQETSVNFATFGDF